MTIMGKAKGLFKPQAMTMLEETDFQENERKTYSPEYQFGHAWTPVQNISYSKQQPAIIMNSLAEGGYIANFPELAIGGVLWIDNNRIFFTDLRKGRTSTLRLRVSAGLPFCALGAFWIPREERLVIHDVYKFGGKNLWKSMKFSERWSELGKIVGKISQDAEFQGFTLELMNAKPLHEAAATDMSGPIAWIQPEAAGVRSLRIFGMPAATPTAAPAPAPAETQNHVMTTTTLQVSSSTTASELLIGKDPVRIGPEAYRLWSPNGEDAGQPAIQKLSVSQAIRTALVNCGKDKVAVAVRWNVSFGRYEVLNVK
jgi:hypothetical protein